MSGGLQREEHSCDIHATVVEFGSTRARTGTAATVQYTEYAPAVLLLYQSQRSQPLNDVLQRPAERAGFMLPTALQARRHAAYCSGKVLFATTPLSSTQSQYTAENYTKLSLIRRTAQQPVALSRSLDMLAHFESHVSCWPGNTPCRRTFCARLPPDRLSRSQSRILGPVVHCFRFSRAP